MNSREAFEEWLNTHHQELKISKYITYDSVLFDVWQASRKQLLKELSEKEPVAYKDTTYGNLHQISYGHEWIPLIIRPTEEE